MEKQLVEDGSNMLLSVAIVTFFATLAALALYFAVILEQPNLFV